MGCGAANHRPAHRTVPRQTRQNQTEISRRRNRGQAGFFNRDKASLDLFRLRDESLEDSDNLPDPDVLAQEIVDDLESALEQFRQIATDLRGQEAEPEKG
jgi:type I restriction enzyme M protein